MKKWLQYNWLLITLLAIFLFVGSSLSVPKMVAAQTQASPAINDPQDEIQAADSMHADVVHLYLFYGDGCPHCEKEREFLKELKADYQSQIQITEFEVYYHPQHASLMERIGNELNLDVSGVPLLFIEDEVLVGFGSATTTGRKINNLIEECQKTACQSRVDEIVDESGLTGQVITVTPAPTTSKQNDQKTDDQQPIDDSGSDRNLGESDFTINVPVIGAVNLKQLSLPVLTMLLGFLDGFNPCAMWILIFLITMLINLEDKKRLFTLGFTFIFVSALVYFGFLAAWFNLFQFIGYVYWIRLLVGIVAIGSGIMHLKNYYEKETGCKVTNKKQRSRIMKRVEAVIHRRSIWLALAGISLLAVSVNMIELVCSAGLPAIYTNLLALSHLPAWEYYLYLILYTIVFMIDDLFIFTVAVKSFQVTGITSKYTKMSNLVGGLLILLIGILLLFRPQALMFG